MKYKSKMKRGLSAIVGTVVLIALVVAAIGVVWAVVNNLVNEELKEAGSCLDVVGKVNIGPEYTCYDSQNNLLNIYITKGDVEVDKILISVTKNGVSKSFDLFEGAKYTYLKDYGTQTYNSVITFPEKNSGQAYTIRLTGVEGLGLATGNPEIIKASPKINDKLCEEYDSYVEIPDCGVVL